MGYSCDILRKRPYFHLPTMHLYSARRFNKQQNSTRPYLRSIHAVYMRNMILTKIHRYVLNIFCCCAWTSKFKSPWKPDFNNPFGGLSPVILLLTHTLRDLFIWSPTLSPFGALPSFSYLAVGANRPFTRPGGGTSHAFCLHRLTCSDWSLTLM